MIRHIALYKLTQKAYDEGVGKVVEKLDRSVKGMVGNVKGLLHAEVALNLESNSPHDLFFYSEFENMDDIPPYLMSEAHKNHADMADGYVCDKEGVDVEV